MNLTYQDRIRGRHILRRQLNGCKKRFGLHHLLIDTHPETQHAIILALGVYVHQILVSRIDLQDIFGGTEVMIEVTTKFEKPLT